MEQKTGYDHSGGVPGGAPWEAEYREYWEDRFCMPWDQIVEKYKGGFQVADSLMEQQAAPEEPLTHREEREIYNRQWNEEKEIRRTHNVMLYDGNRQVQR